MRALVPLLCGVLLAVPTVGTAQAKGEVEAAIHKGSQDWAAAWNAGDAGAIAALYADDAAVMAPGGEPAMGRAAIKSAMEGAIQAAAGSQMSIKTLEIMKGGNLAVEIGSFTSTGADGSHIDHGRYIAVWKKVGNSWMIVRDIWNSSM